MRSVNLLFFRVQSTDNRVQLHAECKPIVFLEYKVQITEYNSMRNVNLLFFRVQSTDNRVQLHAECKPIVFLGGDFNCTLYSVICTLYSIICTLYSVICTLIIIDTPYVCQPHAPPCLLKLGESPSGAT